MEDNILKLDFNNKNEFDRIIDIIIKQNQNLFGNNPKIEKINVGFTNTIYNINNTYIVKICTDKNNEKEFLKEIEFYKNNKENSLIPKLYISNIDKKHIPYFYEIIEKIEGVSLYNVWHTFDEKQKEEIIKQICEAMKQFHSKKGIKYNWIEIIKEEFLSLYENEKISIIFNEEEKKLLEKASSKFEKYLKSDEFVLIHNDLHFDNIIFNNGKIKIIDFERSMYAPRDFELDIIYRMIRKPWKFASEETEKYTNLNDYTNIISYIEKYYPELINIENIYKRLAIYDIIYYVRQLVKHSDIKELKNDIINSAKIVVLEEI